MDWLKKKKIALEIIIFEIQSPLVIVDSSVSGKMSTITSNSTITGEIHAKIDNQSAQSVHYNEKFHYYEIVHYYERRLYLYSTLFPPTVHYHQITRLFVISLIKYPFLRECGRL